MSAEGAWIPIDPREEIPALIETLLAAERRLEELTAGEVDTIAGRDGRAFLLGRGQEQMRSRAAARQEETAAILLRQNAELRALFDLMPAMIWFKDTENRILRVNQRVAEAAGKAVEEIEGRPSLEIYPHDAARSYAGDLAVIRSGIAETGIIEKVKDEAGRLLWIQTDKVPVRDASGKITGIIVVARDISERKLAEQTLQESEEHFRFLNDITEATRSLFNPEKVMAVMAQMLGQHLCASRCAYADVEEDGERFSILYDYTDRCASTVGSYRLSLFGPKAVDELQRGQTLIVRDVDGELAPGEGADMFNAIGIKAIITCPLIREGGLRALMAVHQTIPRDWKPAEVALVQEVVGRCWSTIERRAAEEKILQNERLLRIAGGMARLGGWALDVPGARVTWSDEVCAIHEVPPGTSPLLEEALGYYEPASRETLGKAFKICLGDGTAFDLELELVTATGRPVTVRSIGEAQRNTSGLITRVHEAFQDITERKATAESLRLLSSAVEHSKESIMITESALERPGPRIIFVNPAFTQMTGYSADEVIGKTPRILQGPLTDKSVLSRLRTCLAGGELFQGTTINYRKDGTAFDLDWQIAPMRGAQGKITHFVAIQRDVTARKTAEDALRMSEKRFKTLFDHAAVGFAVTDVDSGRFLQVNQRFCELAGRSSRELQDLVAPDLIHPDDRRLRLEGLEQLKVGASREFTGERRFLRKDGSIVWANITVSPMWSIGERPDSFITVALDISEKKRLEEQFRQAQKMEAIGTLAGGIAHDFNNVLAAINGYTELAKMELKGNATIVEYLDAVLHGTRRATDLVRQILAFSRQQEIERLPIQLRAVVEEALKLLRATIPATIAFETEFAADAPMVLADASQVHQMVMNLCTNAAHAMKDRPGRLMLKLEKFNVDLDLAATRPGLRCGIYARLSVSDTGSGMDQATVNRIFDPFFTTKAPGEGTGLGLAVVHGIMQSHEGAVTVYSHLGEGTTFHLYFPEHMSIESAVAGRPLTTVPWGLGERILYVDDEAPLVLIGKKILERLGYVVDTCANAAEALALVRAHPAAFDLVVTDQTMPGMTGIALAEKIHALRPSLPVILTTGYSATLTLERLQMVGIRKLLLKPLTYDALGSAVSSVLLESKPN